jgi:flagellar biosynthesis/type III secretory pathway M-ring protein FliF/YscJ
VDLPELFRRWSALSQSVRIALAATAVVIVGAAVCVANVARPFNVSLFAAPLHPEQLSEVEERLAGWNVPFTPTSDNVLVAAKRRSELLLRLSLAGVPHGHIESSSDVLAKVGALTPQEIVEAQTREGLAGDIELGLRGVQGVDDVRVIVAPAKEAYFADEASHDATASVRLRLHDGARLSGDAVAGIRTFVASSVPGLEPQRVAIVDDRGVALEDGEQASDGGDLQTSLQSALDSALGTGAVVVRVRVDYDRHLQTVHDVRNVPLGTLANTSNDEQYAEAGKRYRKTSQQTDRGSDTQDTTTTAAGPRVTRISAALFVDAARNVDLYKVRALASATLGLDARRGDTLSVEAIDFHQAPVPRKDAWWLAYGAIVPLLPALAIAAALVLAVKLGAPSIATAITTLGERFAIVRTQSDAISGRLAPAQVRGALAHEPPHAAAAIISALPAATAAAVLDLYPPHERAAIVKRMQRPASPLLADAETLIARG